MMTLNKMLDHARMMWLNNHTRTMGTAAETMVMVSTEEKVKHRWRRSLPSAQHL